MPDFCPGPQLWLAGRTVPRSRLWGLSPPPRGHQGKAGLEGGVCCRHGLGLLRSPNPRLSQRSAAPTVSVAALHPLPRRRRAAGPGAGALCAACCLLGSGGYRHVLPMGTTSQAEISFFLPGHTLLLKKPAKYLMEKNTGLCG